MTIKPTYEDLEQKVRELEKKVVEQDQKSIDILNCLADQVVYHDTDMRIAWANSAAAEALSMPLEQFAGKYCYEIWHQKTNICDNCHVDKVLETGLSQTGTINLPNGNILSVGCYPIFDNNRKIQGVLEVVSDITDRKSLEEDLRESEERFRTVLEASPDPVVVYDMNGNVIFFNAAFTKIFGWTLEERLGKKMDQFVPEENWPEINIMIEKVLAGERISGIETRRYTKEGNIIPINLSAAIYKDRDGNPSGSVVNLQDISDQKRIQTKLQQAQKMESIGILAGGIAHDFNNLLSIIMGNISLAEDDIEPESGISEFLKEANKACLRSQELTKQLITFSKGGAPVKKPGSIGDLVKDTTISTTSGFNVRCEFFLPHNLWLVEIDEDQMKHAIKNMIVNAVESMPDGGSIDVRAENFSISSETVEQGLKLYKGKYIKISIRDQGVGIPEEHLPMIFDPYFSTKEMGVQKGLGLGLSITYSIISRHDGQITVESKLGVGTTFALYLPVYEKDIRELKPVEILKPEKPAIRTGRILLMDDEEMTRNLANQILNRFGYDVELAKDGVEVIELYKKALDSGKSFEVIILDLTIKGGMGGKDAIKKILQINPQAKAIVSSGYSNDPVMTDYRKHGFIGSLPKPYTMKDLSVALSMVVSEKKPIFKS